ncbi:putative plastid-lipid-associated protein 6, chloroplastic, partial [Tetrabaena socialis]
SLGGRRPGPPAALFPTILGQVYQRIEPGTAQLDNIVELLLSYGPPDLGLGLTQALKQGLAGLGVSSAQLPQPLQGLLGAGDDGGGEGAAPRDSPAARLTLRHDYEVVVHFRSAALESRGYGTSRITGNSTVKIVYEETFGELVGSSLFSQLPRLAAPSLPDVLKPPKFLRSATFQVTFLDPVLRITRGDRGELRVYLRDEEAGAAVGGKGWGTVAATALDYDD